MARGVLGAVLSKSHIRLPGGGVLGGFVLVRKVTGFGRVCASKKLLRRATTRALKRQFCRRAPKSEIKCPRTGIPRILTRCRGAHHYLQFESAAGLCIQAENIDYRNYILQTLYVTLLTFCLCTFLGTFNKLSYQLSPGSAPNCCDLLVKISPSREDWNVALCPEKVLPPGHRRVSVVATVDLLTLRCHQLTIKFATGKPYQQYIGPGDCRLN